MGRLFLQTSFPSSDGCFHRSIGFVLLQSIDMVCHFSFINYLLVGPTDVGPVLSKLKVSFPLDELRSSYGNLRLPSSLSTTNYFVMSGSLSQTIDWCFAPIRGGPFHGPLWCSHLRWLLVVKAFGFHYKKAFGFLKMVCHLR